MSKLSSIVLAALAFGALGVNALPTPPAAAATDPSESLLPLTSFDPIDSRASHLVNHESELTQVSRSIFSTGETVVKDGEKAEKAEKGKKTEKAKKAGKKAGKVAGGANDVASGAVPPPNATD